MRMGVFWERLGLERIGPRMLGCSKWRMEVSSGIKMAIALLAGWQRPAYLTFDLPLDMADWGSSLERQRWVFLWRLISLLMGQLAWEECCFRTCPGKQKTAFQTLCADSMASLTYGTATTTTIMNWLTCRVKKRDLENSYFAKKWWLWCYIRGGENPGLLICSVSVLARLTQTHASN